MTSLFYQCLRSFKFTTAIVILLSPLLISCNSGIQEKSSITTSFRAPAYPLITVDPYMSGWSESDQLFDEAVKHWTGKTRSLIGALRVDGTVYRFLGKETIPWKALVPMAAGKGWEGKYLLTQPTKGWETTGFKDDAWKTGKAAFGTSGMPSLSTLWETKDIWVRREFNFPENMGNGDLYLIYSHDDDFELWLNGKKLVETGYSWKNNVVLPIDKSLLIPNGKNVIAAHGQNRVGGAYVDFGLFQKSDEKEVFAQTAVQKSVSLSATQTHYEFACGPVDLKLKFVAPLLPKELDILSRPINYVNYEVASTDGKDHEVQIYFEATPEWAVNQTSQEVVLQKGHTTGLTYLTTGTTEQPILAKKGDDLRIDWGYFYLSGKEIPQMSYAIGDYFGTKKEFIAGGRISSSNDPVTTTIGEKLTVLALVDGIGKVSSNPANGFIMIGYDDIFSLQYFGTNLKAWWTQNGKISMDMALQSANNEHDVIMNKCVVLDNELWNDAINAGGKKYADLCVLAFRQSISAHKLAKDTLGNIVFLSKENFSNGSIGTVDVTYPSAPLFLYYNPELLKGMMNPIFHFSESGKWKKPFAAHDVGTYPLANGQTYGGDMPVEESGNMLILATAISQIEGNAKYAEQHWDVLTTWANYLLESGLDPENQLCTDDFAGHFAHNANLSIKAIMGIAGYGRMAEMLGKKDIALKYTESAKQMSQKWIEMAIDGDHYKLTFDQAGTWSQKYNLVWDKLLKLDIFPKEVAQTEVAYYLTKQNTYGLPLDNRKTYTKSDWIVWTATLAEDTASFQKLIDPVHKYVIETPSRVPNSDWYETTNAKMVGFQARSVVGGYFIKILKNRQLAK